MFSERVESFILRLSLIFNFVKGLDENASELGGGDGEQRSREAGESLNDAHALAATSNGRGNASA